jgi:hypothetical protein
MNRASHRFNESIAASRRKERSMHLRTASPFIVTAFTVLLAGCGGLGADLGQLRDGRITATGAGLLVSEDGQARLEGVFSAAPGWVCVHADLLGQPGTVLGCAAVPLGESTNIPVSIDMSRLSWTVHLVLHEDAGVPGQLELPEPDLPARSGLGTQVSIKQVLLSDPAWISVTDQLLGPDRTIVVDRVYTPVPALLVIHDVRDQHVLGFASIRSGENFGVPIVLEERGEVVGVIAELHWDIRDPGQLNLTDPASKDTSGEFMKVPFRLSASN